MKKVCNILVNWSFNTNMNVTRFIFVLLLFNCPFLVKGQLFNNLYNNNNAEGYSDVVLRDSILYCSGFSQDFGDFLIPFEATNLYGNSISYNELNRSSIYKYTLGTGENFHILDSTFMLSGSRSASNIFNGYFSLITLGGDSIKTVVFQDSTLIQSSIFLDDSTMILAGSTNNHNSSTTDWDMWVVKCDTAGNIIWQNNFGGIQQDEVYSIDQTHDNGFVLAGYTNSFGAGSFDIFVVKIDSQGNFEWQKTFGDTESEAGYVKALSNGDILVYGAIKDPTFQESHAAVFKIDSLGNQKWLEKYRYSIDKSHWFESMVVVNDGYVFCGSSIDEDDNNPLGWILKTDFDGNELWSRRYRKRDNDNYFRDITELPNGDLALCGFVFPENGTQTQDAWLVRTNCIGYDTLPIAQASIVSNSNVDMTVELDNDSKYWGNCIINWGDGTSNYLYEDYDTLITHQYQSVNTWDIEVIALACDDSDTSHIQISTDLSGVGLDENELDSGFTMFPNPTSDEVEITLNNNFYSGDITVFVHNLMGQEMKSFQAEEANGAERFSVRAFTNGVYIVTIRDEEGVQHTGKLVVQH